MKHLIHTSLLILSLFLCACGGGGGGGSDNPADLSVYSEPSTIDGGDFMTVHVQISNSIDQGIILKVRAPIGLTYLTDSSYITVDSTGIKVDPTFSKADDKYTYLVYFFRRTIFGDSNYGDLKFQYEGTGSITTGTIDVDSDVFNPNESFSSQFNVKTPNFTAQDSQKVVVNN